MMSSPHFYPYYFVWSSYNFDFLLKYVETVPISIGVIIILHLFGGAIWGKFYYLVAYLFSMRFL